MTTTTFTIFFPFLYAVQEAVGTHRRAGREMRDFILRGDFQRATISKGTDQGDFHVHHEPRLSDLMPRIWRTLRQFSTRFTIWITANRCRARAIWKAIPKVRGACHSGDFRWQWADSGGTTVDLDLGIPGAPTTRAMRRSFQRWESASGLTTLCTRSRTERFHRPMMW